MRTSLFVSFIVACLTGANAMEIHNASGVDVITNAKEMCPTEGLA